jgi:hypothetical protein
MKGIREAVTLGVTRRWCGHDGDRRHHHVAFSRDGEAGAPPSAKGCVTLIGGILKNGMQWR